MIITSREFYASNGAWFAQLLGESWIFTFRLWTWLNQYKLDLFWRIISWDTSNSFGEKVFFSELIPLHASEIRPSPNRLRFFLKNRSSSGMDFVVLPYLLMVFQHLPTTWDVFFTRRKSMGITYQPQLVGSTPRWDHLGLKTPTRCGLRGGVRLEVVLMYFWWMLVPRLLVVDGGCLCWWWLLALSWTRLNWMISSMPLHWPLQMPKIYDPKILQKAWDMDFVDCIMVPDGEVRFETSKISVEFGWWCSVSRHPRFRWFAVQEEGNKKRH